MCVYTLVVGTHSLPQSKITTVKVFPRPYISFIHLVGPILSLAPQSPIDFLCKGQICVTIILSNYVT